MLPADVQAASARYFGADFAYPAVVTATASQPVSRANPRGENARYSGRHFSVAAFFGIFGLAPGGRGAASLVSTSSRVFRVYAYRDGVRAAALAVWRRHFMLYAAGNGRRGVLALLPLNRSRVRLTVTRVGAFAFIALPGATEFCRVNLGYTPTETEHGVVLRLGIGSLFSHLRHAVFRIEPGYSAFSAASRQSWTVASLVPADGSYDLRSLWHCSAHYGKAWPDWKAKLMAFRVRRTTPKNRLPFFRVGLKGLRSEIKSMHIVGRNHFMLAYLKVGETAVGRRPTHRDAPPSRQLAAAERLILKWSGFDRCEYVNTSPMKRLEAIAAASLQPVPLAAQAVGAAPPIKPKALLLKW